MSSRNSSGEFVAQSVSATSGRSSLLEIAECDHPLRHAAQIAVTAFWASKRTALLSLSPAVVLTEAEAAYLRNSALVALIEEERGPRTQPATHQAQLSGVDVYALSARDENAR